MELKIETTSDGSPTLYRPDIDEHYHSMKGALAESLHVYVDLGWNNVARLRDAIRVLEVGFGTGMNAALTAKSVSETQKHTTYFSVELYPLGEHTTGVLAARLSEEYRQWFLLVNEAPWNVPVEINPYFTLVKIKANLLTVEIPHTIDLVYFDAFAPEKQPDIWDESVFRKLHRCMTPGGVLTTYCAKGTIRRMLAQIGFVAERLPGPPQGKREVLRARKRWDLGK